MLDVEDKAIVVNETRQPPPKNSKPSIDPCIIEDDQHANRDNRQKRSIQPWLSLTTYQDRNTWSPSWAHLGPLSGLFALCIVAGSLVASIAILLGSDNSNIESWPTPPSTFVALFTAIGNLGVRYALAQGILVTWWLRACHGSTLSGLQMDWRAGTGIRGAVSAGRSMGMLGIACLFSSVILIDGPLLQRASTPASTHVPLNQTLQVLMAPELPHGWSGEWSDAIGIHPNPAFNDTVPTTNGSIRNNVISSGLHAHAQTLWESTESLQRVVSGCKGECHAAIRAPAVFATSCKTQHVQINPNIGFNFTDVYDTESAAPLTAEVFIITANLLVRGRSTEAIDLITGYALHLNENNCTGELIYNICTLEAGIGEYDIVVQNDHINMELVESPRFVAFANNTGVNTGPQRNSTLAAVVNYMRLKWESFVALWVDPDSGLVEKLGDVGVINFVEGGRFGYHDTCASYRDPYHDMLKEMNRLMMYLGAAAAKEDQVYLASHLDAGLSVNTEVIGLTKKAMSIYRTRYWPIVVAAAVDALCIALIAPLYWKWWTLGRVVSFSPLELAKAFRSPLLTKCHSNSSANDLSNAARQVAVQYGLQRNSSGDDSELSFGDPTGTRRLEGTVRVLV